MDAGPSQQGGKTGNPDFTDGVFRSAFIVSLLSIAFVFGAVLAKADLFPGAQVARAYEGGRALYAKLTAYENLYDSDLWFTARRADTGVTVHRPSRAQAGVTLYTSGHDAAAFLIDMDGKVVHEWRRPFSTVWTKESGIQKPRPDAYIYFRKARVYPNGDLLAVYEGAGDTPYGYGIVKLDRDSNVLWTYFGRAHHDVDIGPDGRIYAITHEFSRDRLVNLEHLATPRLDDFLVVLSPDGEELRKIRLIDLVARSQYRQILYTVSTFAVADALHTNNVDVITGEMAANFPYGEPGQVLLSFRELGSIAVLDPQTEKITWMTRGPWIGQHDPDILPSGNILLFDNYGAFRQSTGESRVIEFDPRTMQIVWTYEGTRKSPLDSLIRSEQERLSNGNTLITEGNGGRIVEVTPDGAIAWEYLNPVRASDSGRPPQIPIICWAQRLDTRDVESFVDDPAIRRTTTSELSR